jgi:hypothetical protein
LKGRQEPAGTAGQDAPPRRAGPAAAGCRAARKPKWAPRPG